MTTTTFRRKRTPESLPGTYTVISSTVSSHGISFGAVQCRDDANGDGIDFGNQDAITDDGLSTTPLRLQKRVLAPAESPVHKELVKAAAEGQHTTRLEYLLAQGANIDTRGAADLTALYNAAFRGDSENVQLLLASGADVNSWHTFSGTPVCIAALKGHADVVEALLSHKASLNIGRGVMSSAIHCACFSGNISIVKSLLDRGASLDRKVSLDMRVLYQLRYKMIKASLNPFRNEELDHRAITCSPILLLAERCHFKLLQLCWAGYNEQPPCSPDDIWNARISDKPSFDDRTNNQSSTSSDWSFLGFPRSASRRAAAPSQNCTLLMWAAASLKFDLIDHLLVAGAKVDAQDDSGWSALHYAASPFTDAMFDNLGVCIQRLVKGGANLGILDGVDRTPLMLAIDRYHITLDPRLTRKWGSDLQTTFIKTFLDVGGNVEMEETTAYSVLLHAIRYGCRPETIALICKNGAAPRLASTGGLLALQLALGEHSDEAYLPILLQHGADPNARPLQGIPEPVFHNQLEYAMNLSPLSMAICHGASDAVITALLKHGANPDECVSSVTTPRRLAETQGRIDISPPSVVMSTGTPPPALTPGHSWLQRISGPVFRTHGKSA
jgi:ankyrin repeat protein